MAAALDQRGMGHYFRTHFLDKTFQGLYQVNAFDLALLIPYFIVLILLASYGIHRYVLVYLYYKHRKNKVSAPAGRFDGGVDADYLAIEIDERPAARPRIDGRVGLEEVLDADGRAKAHLAVLPADDSMRHRLVEPEWRPESQHPLTDAHFIAVSEKGGRQRVVGQPEHGDIGLRVRPDARRLEDSAIGQVDRNLIRRRLADDVIVGQHMRSRGRASYRLMEEIKELNEHTAQFVQHVANL